ncbi:MAG: glucosamine-6-phosphate deaminase [Oscillospiraceae bacterium]|jgi:glucosamine-6-phosphate deaminase|nr:glucosamine-6-phosphate deaminase [Oscillospiraceae bacterium]
MEIIRFESIEDIGQTVGNIICDAVLQKPNTVLGLATGASPITTYKQMIRRHQRERLSFAKVHTFNLDEYCDLPISHPTSYHSFMCAELFSDLDIPNAQIHFLDGNTDNEFAESERYREAIEAVGGIDIQLLGIGRNGHIGFNEPAENFTGEAFKVALAPSTIEANRIWFSGGAAEVPKYAMTMGIGQIMKARKILLIATGAAKADAVYGMVKGAVTPHMPASILQTHPDVTVYIDAAAGAKL